MSIYVARGEDTLGPYTAEEAVALIRRDLLSLDDLAARNGDAAWVPLSTFLPLAEIPAPVHPSPAPSFERRGRSAAMWVAVVLMALLLAGMAAFEFGQRAAPAARSVQQPRAVTPAQVPATSTSAPALTPTVPPLVAARPMTLPLTPMATSERATALMVAATPREVASPPPVARRDCRLSGTISLVSSHGEPIRFPGIRVTAYRLESLGPLLAEKDALLQSKLAPLAPQLKAVAAEKDAREAAAKAALQASLDAAPNDPLKDGLGFAARQARDDLVTAATDYQYLLDQRAEIMDGEMYYKDLPAPLAEAQTDAAGRFTLGVPTGGEYAVAACVRQTGLTGTRTHYWLVKVDLPDGSEKTLPLSNDNAASSGSADSLVQ